MWRKSLPCDVVVFDRNALLHARFERSKGPRRITRARVLRLAEGTISGDPVTPSISDQAALEQALRRLRQEAGEFEHALVLLPDSWFRLQILELPSLPDRAQEADEVIRWSFRRSLPSARQDDLRIAWQRLERSNGLRRVLVIGAMEKTLRMLEEIFAAQQIRVDLIEPTGTNVWNAIMARQPQDTANRMFFYLRETEFTIALFTGATPLFYRSRPRGGERTLLQEIRLSASYVRDRLQMPSVAESIVVGHRVEPAESSAISDAFAAPVRVVTASDLGIQSRALDAADCDAELMAGLGVYTS